jgi:hypothetical protein
VFSWKPNALNFPGVGPLRNARRTIPRASKQYPFLVGRHRTCLTTVSCLCRTTLILIGRPTPAIRQIDQDLTGEGNIDLTSQAFTIVGTGQAWRVGVACSANVNGPYIQSNPRLPIPWTWSSSPKTWRTRPRCDPAMSFSNRRTEADSPGGTARRKEGKIQRPPVAYAASLRGKMIDPIFFAATACRNDRHTLALDSRETRDRSGEDFRG